MKKVKNIQLEFQNLNSKTIDFMVANAIYPMCSKKGNVFLRCSKKGLLMPEKTKEIIKELNIKSPEECEELRKEIKREVAKCRVSRPIKEWIEEFFNGYVV